MNLKKIHKNINKGFILFLFISLNFISCNKKSDEHSIEIYLLNDRIKSNDGIPISKIKDFKKMDTIFLKSISNIANYDTKTKEFIYAGKFEVNSEQINSSPLITNNEITNFNLKTNKIELSTSGATKIMNLKPSMKNGIQFVICDNKKPLLTGYFWSSYSSYGSTWNCIEFDQTSVNKKLNLYKGNGIDVTKRTHIDFNNFKEFVKVFKQTNKLIE